MKLIFKLAVAALIANAAWRVSEKAVFNKGDGEDR